MFEKISIYEALKKRTDDESRLYCGLIDPLYLNMKALLENIKAHFVEYPDHGIEHTKRILVNISHILDSKSIKGLSSLEIMILVFSALFHDSGMSLINETDDKDYILKNHHKLATKVINTYFDNYLMNIPQQNRIRESVIFICEAHNLSLEELVNDTHFGAIDTIGTFDVRYGILAFLLRIGDLMDLEADNINCYRMMFSDSFNEDGFEGNIRQSKIKRYQKSSKAIEIEVTADNANQYLAWAEWFSLLKQDIEKYNAIYAGECFRIPIPKTLIIKPNEAEYDVEKVHLDIDEKGKLWDVLSKSVYTYELDFLREIIQNALDASLKKVYLDNTKTIETESPRVWGNLAEKIVIVYSPDNKMLYVIDRGIGMDKADLNRFLFTIGSSGKADNKNRPFDFPGIAQFGVGFVSCLANAERITVYTSKDTRTLNKATLEAKSNTAIVEKKNNIRGYIGTTIILKLNKQYTDVEISEYLKTTFVFPSVPIAYYGINRIKDALNSEELNCVFQFLKEKPDSFEEYIKSFSCSIGNITNAFTSEIETLEKQIEEFEDDYKKILKMRNNPDKVKAESDWNELKKSSKHNTNLFNEFLIKNLKTVPFKSKEFDKSLTLVERAVYSTYFEKNNALHKKIIENTFPIILDNKSIDFEPDWKYKFIELDSHLKLLKNTIIESNEPFSIKNKTGVLVIKQVLCDYDRGIECVATSGFLIKNRKNTYRLGIQNEEHQEGTDGLVNDILNGLRYSIKVGYDCFIAGHDMRRELNMLLAPKNAITTAIPYDDETIFFLLRNNKQIDSPLYQDGILVSKHMPGLLPIGATRTCLNLTAGSRLMLNVTRHDISETPTDLSAWFDGVGKYIQKYLLNGIRAAFIDFGMVANLEPVDRRDDASYFDKLSISSLKQLLNDN